MAHTRQKYTFDPDRLAHLEIAGLRAYYDHKWLVMLRLLVQLVHEQFGLSWPRAIQSVYYFVRASVAWAPEKNDPRLVRRYIRKSYLLTAKHGSLPPFDPREAADREFRYWDLHRRYAGRPEGEKEPYVRSLAALHSILFGLPTSSVMHSAVERARATDYIDLVTGHRSTDIEGDWQRAEQHLHAAYGSIKQHL